MCLECKPQSRVIYYASNIVGVVFNHDCTSLTLNIYVKCHVNAKPKKKNTVRIKNATSITWFVIHHIHTTDNTYHDTKKLNSKTYYFKQDLRIPPACGGLGG